MKLIAFLIFKVSLLILSAVIIALAILLLVFYNIFKNFKDPYHKKVTDAGFVEKTAEIRAVNFNYAEGPNNGPALLLLHAQHMDWYSYSRVLPALSKSFHIFAVDYHGHGKTTAKAECMNANQIGEDLASFIETVIREPAYISGNSSGGILAAWLAANAPQLAKAVVLEDPSLFSSEYPRILDTIADKSFSICYDFVQAGEDDFLLYWIKNCRGFFIKQVGFDVGPLLEASIKSYRRSNPGKAVEIIYLPGALRLMMRGMSSYDPHFGAAFHDGSWNGSFDHAEALSKIQCPALLLHADFSLLEDGTLNGAIDQDEADRIVSLIPGVEYKRINSSHVIHLDKPEKYIRIIEKFFLDS
ncbi:MAG: alpha/beta hydrolase [Clostridiales bacterium]|jgi:pimeloyl-ACP methyl ester carboxylesterase|nr:alpha/beta hydrolase [Clostridiales bacterium]